MKQPINDLEKDILETLQRMALPTTDTAPYWVEVTTRSENATDFICYTDEAVKDLIEKITTSRQL